MSFGYEARHRAGPSKSTRMARRGGSVVSSVAVISVLGATAAFATGSLNSDLDSGLNGVQKAITLSTPLDGATAETQSVDLWTSGTTAACSVTGSQTGASDVDGTMSAVTVPGDGTKASGEIDWTTPAAQASDQTYDLVLGFAASGCSANTSGATVTVTFTVAGTGSDLNPCDSVGTPTAPVFTNAPSGWSNDATLVPNATSDGDVSYSVDSATGPFGAAGALAQGAHTVYAEATDTQGCGKTSDVTSATYDMDYTPPSVSVTGVSDGVQYVLGSVPSAGCDTEDQTGLSGVATSATVSLTGGTVGAVTATCSGATDNAGNAADPVSVTYTVIYAWTGFFQPVDNLPTINSVKAGSGIPVKFNLGGNQGLSAVVSETSRQVNCATSAPTDAIETTTTAAGGSSLTYDTTANQYVYVWKTDKAWASTCRTLTVTLDDTTTHQATFHFTK